MITALLILLLVLAIVGGFAVNHLLWIVIAVAIVGLLLDHRRV